MNRDPKARVKSVSIGTLRFAVLAIVFGSCCIAQPIQSSQAETERVQRGLQEYYSAGIAEAAVRLFRNLSPSEVRTFEHIAIQVSLSNDPNMAHALPPHNGSRLVEISVAFMWNLDLTIDAALLAEVKGAKAGFMQKYFDYVLNQTEINRQRSFRNLAPIRINGPLEFAGMSKRQIDQFDAEHQKERASILTSAIAYLVAHEVGHHILDHPGHAAKTKAESRENESRADEWATRLLLRNGFNPLAGIYVLAFNCVRTDGGLEDEQGSTHPADIRRIRTLYRTVKEDEAGLRYLARGLGISSVDLVQKIDDALAAAEEEYGN